MQKDPNRFYKERVKSLNLIHDELEKVCLKANSLEHLDKRREARELVHRIIDNLEKLDNLLDGRGR